MFEQLQHSGIKRAIIAGENFLKSVGRIFFPEVRVREHSCSPDALTAKQIGARFQNLGITNSFLSVISSMA